MSSPTVSTKPLKHMPHSHYVRLKALLAVTLICVVGLATATAILAISNDTTTSRGLSSSAPPVTGSDYRGDQYTTGMGASQCLFLYHKC